MASIVGALFEEYSPLNPQDQAAAVGAIGANVSFVNSIGPGDTQRGTSENDVFHVDNADTKIIDKGGIDLVVSSVTTHLPGTVEHLLLTGEEDLEGYGNAKDNVIAGNEGNNLLDGGAGNDALVGGGGNDTLDGGAADDSLYGGEGDDSATGGAGRDYLSGGDGNDTLIGGGGQDTLEGGEGDDHLIGSTSDDSIAGDAGNDSIVGDTGNDSLDGGAGSDTITGGMGLDTVVAGSGDDILTGGGGADMFYFGNDTGTAQITDFDIGMDIISIANDAVNSVADVLATVMDDGAGNAVFEIGDKTVTLLGIDDDDVNDSFFSIP